MDLINKLRERAKGVKGTVVLPESFDLRTLEAARIITDLGMAHTILLGDPEKIRVDASNNDIDLQGIEIVDPRCDSSAESYAEHLFQRRKKKGMTLEEARKQIEDVLYFGCGMVQSGDASGMVAGAANTTADVLRAALHMIGVQAGLKTVSSSFIMVVPDFMGAERVFMFADCAVVPNPTDEQLADITISTATTMQKLLGVDPRVALLSFSTMGSAEHELVDKVLSAKNILQKREVSFPFDGELQLDAAIVQSVGKRKAPQSPVAGDANVLIFPDLQSGNICYKAVQRFAKAEAVGPVIQGLALPVCDLSRGCSVDDIVNTAALVLLMSV